MSYLQDCRTSLLLPSLSPSSKQEDIIHRSSCCSYCGSRGILRPCYCSYPYRSPTEETSSEGETGCKKAAEAAEAAADAAEAITATHTPTPTPIIPTTSAELMDSEPLDTNYYRFPFLISNEQAKVLSEYTYAQWMIHVNRVRKEYSENHDTIPPEVESFLRLPRAEIIAAFQEEVALLVQEIDPPDSHPPE